MNIKNFKLLSLLLNNGSKSLIYTKQFELRRQSLYNLSSRFTSTTSTSKGQSISLTNLSIKESDVNRKLDLTFEDSKTAFKSKSNLELLRGYLVFQLCSINFLVENQKTLLSLSRRVLGKRLFTALMKSTFYGHFVAGEDQQSIRPNVENMMKYGVKSILDYSAEEDLSGESLKSNDQENLSSHLSLKRKIYNQSEIQFEKNTKIFMDCIDAVSDVTKGTGLGAVKFTSLLRPELLLKFSSFTSALEAHDKLVAKQLLAWKNLVSIDEAKLNDIILKVPQGKEKFEFDSNELKEIINMFLRIDEIIQHAHKKNVRVFIDAEQTYFQNAIHRLTIELMRHYNKDSCIVLNTYQNYLKSAFDTLKEDIELSREESFCFGAKLVRGAYMEQERARAKEMNYPDPINDNYDATTQMYEKSFIYCMEETKRRPLGKICVMVASHNEGTVKFAVEKMKEYNIEPSAKIVCFGQLLGMCDYISFYLGGVGYSVYKYVPYGPLEEVLPYLSRRAAENRGIFEKVKKEKRLLITEIKRRIKSPLFA